MRGCHLLSEAGFVAVASQLPRQTRLHLAQWRHVSDASVDLLARKCLQLTELDGSMCDRVGDEAVARAICERAVLIKSVAVNRSQAM